VILKNNMQRTIKFRAWDRDNKVMHYQSVQEDGIAWEIQPTIRFLESRTVDSFPGGVYHEQEEEWVAPNQTVMQFTGLTDKNGKEIYEGDILAGKPLFEGDKPYFEILFGEHTLQGLKHWGWISRSEISTSLLDQSIIENCEIIGNIYENPELCK